MMTGINAQVAQGYTGHDHLISSCDTDAATNAVAGRRFSRALDAHRAACRAYLSTCDRRVRHARITVSLRGARGDVISIG